MHRFRMNRNNWIVCGVLLIICATVLLLFVTPPHTKELTVSFLNIGQGDSIFIQSPTGKQMLIDGGSDRTVLQELGSVMPLGDRSIDVVLATHPHADHVGGLVYVFNQYDVAHYFITGATAGTNVVRELEGDVTHESGLVSHVASRGASIDLGGGVMIEVLYPDKDVSHLEPNDSSTIVRLTYGEISVLLTGDAPSYVEHQLVSKYGESLHSTVLKAGHHGSRYSSSEEFLDTVYPSYVVISSGKDNSYGHPHQETLERFYERNITVFDTAEDGRVTFKTDGTILSVSP